MQTPILTSFQQWTAGMAKANGIDLPSPLNPLGLEFEAEDRVARVIPHSDERLAIIDVDVQSMQAQPEAILNVLSGDLLRINEEARFEHGWSIVLGEDDMVSISTTVRMSDTPAQALDELLAEGIERARNLGKVIDRLMASAAAGSFGADCAGRAINGFTRV